MFSRGDPRWQAYWKDMHRNEAVRAYAFAPFVELDGAVLRACANLLPPYRRRRATRLNELAQSATNYAQHLRTRGIGWFTNESSEVHNPLSRAIWGRYYEHREEFLEDRTGESDALLHGLLEFLFLFESTARSLEREGGAQSGFAKWYFDHVESLLELLGARTEVSGQGPNVFELGRAAILSECEGLAYAQALVDDGYSKHDPDKKKKRKSVHLTEKHMKLAEDIGVDPRVLKEVLETTYSGWWQRVQAFREKRNSWLSSALRHCPGSEVIDLGSPSRPSGEYPYCSVQEARDASERSVEMLIAMFLSFPECGVAMLDVRALFAPKPSS